jgi:hypothetical protein
MEKQVIMGKEFEKEFVLYEQALKLKELGFDKPCIGYYTSPTGLLLQQPTGGNGEFVYYAPLYQQAFRWFRDKHHLYGRVATTSLTCHFIMIEEVTIDGTIGQNPKYKTYTSPDETEKILLDELIKIIESKTK